MYIRLPAVILSLVGVLVALVTSSMSVLISFEIALIVLCIVDTLCAPSPSKISIERTAPPSTRLGESAEQTLVLSYGDRSDRAHTAQALSGDEPLHGSTAPIPRTETTHTASQKLSSRRVRGEVRDAWPPSAGLFPGRQPFEIPSRKNALAKTIAVQKTQPDQSLAPAPLHTAQAMLTSLLTPNRRGTRKSEHLTIRTIGPLRVAGRQSSRPTNWDIRVLPAFTSRKHLPSRIMRLRELEGRALLLVRGQGTEFDSLREYVAGDDVRAIDWRSTARLGNTMVRTWRPERDRHVVIIADAGRGGALRIGDAPAFDAYIESALLTSALASRAGDRVHVMALDSQIHAQVSDVKGGSIINRLGEAFADVEPTLAATNWNAASAQIDKITRQPALIVMLTTVGLSALSDGLLDILPQLAQRHTVLIGSVKRTMAEIPAQATIDSAYRSASDARSELETSTVIQTLRRLGAVVVEHDAEHLPPMLADTYIDLKATGRL